MQQADHQALLNEIFPVPSQQIITNRFSAESESAGCSGRCSSGTCKGITG